MSIIIGISLNLKKLDKNKFKHGKNGAVYYDMTVKVNDEPNKFGKDVMVTEAPTKEEIAEKKYDQPIIGSGKVLWKSSHEAKPEDYSNGPGSGNPSGDDLPF